MKPFSPELEVRWPGPRGGGGGRRRPGWPTGFTLVELLVVVAITAVLVGIILPAVGKARESARLLECAGNLHQIMVAMTAYVAQAGRYPPNSTTTYNQSSLSNGVYWYDDDRLGKYLHNVRLGASADNPIGGGVYVCPGELAGPVFVSYAMNYWAGSLPDPLAATLTAAQRGGVTWSPKVGDPSRMILFVEAFTGAKYVPTGQWTAKPTAGSAVSSGTCTTAAERFGADGGIVVTLGRWGKVASELCYGKHRSAGGPGQGTQPRGRLNVAYADGHVAAKTDRDLVRADGTATGDSWWSPADLVPTD